MLDFGGRRESRALETAGRAAHAAGFDLPDMPVPAKLKGPIKGLVAESARVLGTITHVATRERVVALTFDDGPHPVSTPQVLEVLARHGARATFFMVGKAAARHRELVRRVAESGHAIGNHSWDHGSFPLLKGSWRRRQMRWCQETLAPWGVRLFRPPYGHQSFGSRLDAARVGLRVVTWSVVAEDWQGDDAETLLARVRSRMTAGSIVLFHDALWAATDERHRDRQATVQAVDRLLAESASYRFVTLPELFAAGRPRHWHWYWPSDTEWLRREI